MPRYSYLCESCEQTSEIFHLLNDKPEECSLCLAKESLVKLVSKPVINTSKESPDASAQDRVEGHIEEARKELYSQRTELKTEDILNDS